MHQSRKRIVQWHKTFAVSGSLSYVLVGLLANALVGFEAPTDVARAAESAVNASYSTDEQKSVQQQTERNLSRQSFFGSASPSSGSIGKASTNSASHGRKLIRRPSTSQLVPAEPSASSAQPAVQSSSTTSLTGSIASDSSTTLQKESSTSTSSISTTRSTANGTGSISISTVTSSAVSEPTTSVPSGGSGSTLSSTASASAAAPASGSSSSGSSFAGRALQKLLSRMPALADILSPPSSPASNSTPSASSPMIGRSPASLAFSAVQNGSSPAGQIVTISNIGSGTLNWTAVSSATWLSLNGANSASGTNSGSFTATVNPSGLPVGTHNASITISATGATNTPQTVPVTLTVTAAPAPTIGLSTANLSFTGVQGGTNPASQTVTITNTGSGTLSWNAIENAAWLSVSPASGTGNGSITVSVNTAGLAAGTVSAPITITASGATNTPQTITVSLVVTAPATPTIGYSPASLSFMATQGGTNPSSQTVSITNTGTGTLSWSVTDNATWLSLSPTSGTGNGSVTASVNLTGLAAGTYNAVITIAGTGATNTPQTVPVTLTVSAAPTIRLTPSSLSFTATQGAANPAAQTVNVTNPGGGTLTWTASDNASWLTLSTTSGTTTTETDPITVSINTAGLSAGTYNATITVSANSATNTPQVVPVTLTINPPATSSATLTWNANTESDLAGYKIYRATAPGAYGAPIATLQGNVTSYVATGLQVGTTYYFVVTAYDTAGNESAYSNEVSKSVF